MREKVQGVSCQSKIDYFSETHGIVDLKTCENLNFFENDCKKWGYVYQMAFYRNMVYLASGEVYPVHIIAVEKTAPYRCGVFLIGDMILKQAHVMNVKNIELMKECKEKNSWPTLFEDVRVINTI